MPLGPRIRANNVLGTITDNPLSTGALSFNSALLPLLPVVSSAHAIVTLDPLRQHGNPEMIIITAHAALSTTATITRGAYGTTAREHPQGTVWIHAPMNEDVIPIVTSTTRPTDPYEGEIIYETDTDSFNFWNGTSWVAISTGGSGGAATLGYAQIIATQTGFTSTPADVSGLSVSVTVPAGRRLRITGFGQVEVVTTAGAPYGPILQDGVEIGRWTYDDGATVGHHTYTAAVIVTPSAGTHIYKLQLAKNNGGNTVNFIAAATLPGYILVEDITGTASPFASGSVPVGVLARVDNFGSGQTVAGATLVDITGSNLNVTVPAGRLLKMTAKIHISSATAGARIRLVVREGAAVTGIGGYRVVSGGAVGEEIVIEGIISPSAGAHTYILSWSQDTGAGSATIYSNVTDEVTQFYIEDVTPTPTASSGAPSSTIGYSEVLTNQTTITTEVDLTGLASTVSVSAGRRIRISAEIFPQSSIAGDEIRLLIKEGATTLQIVTDAQHAANQALTMTGSVILTPSAGSHTYKLALLRQSGTGTIQNNAGATFPSFILVEDITGSVFPAGTSVTAGLIASEAWTDWVPVITQGVNVTHTIVYAKYIKMGRVVHGNCSLLVSGAGTATSRVSISTPLPAAIGSIMVANSPVGTATLGDASAPITYPGLCLLDDVNIFGILGTSATIAAADNSILLGNTGSPFTAALAVNDRIILSFIYEAVS